MLQLQELLGDLGIRGVTLGEGRTGDDLGIGIDRDVALVTVVVVLPGFMDMARLGDLPWRSLGPWRLLWRDNRHLSLRQRARRLDGPRPRGGQGRRVVGPQGESPKFEIYPLILSQECASVQVSGDMLVICCHEVAGFVTIS